MNLLETDVPFIPEALAQAMVAAAYEDAAAFLDGKHDAFARVTRSSTPADARAALDAMLAKAREDALREAAERNALTVRSIEEAIDLRDYDAAWEIAMKGNAALFALIDRTAEEGEA